MIVIQMEIANDTDRRFRLIIQDAVNQGVFPPQRAAQELQSLRQRALKLGLSELENVHAAHGLY